MNLEFGTFHGEQILPPSRSSLTLDQFGAEYPLRYQLWESQQTDHYPLRVSPEVMAQRLHMLNNLDRYINSQQVKGSARLLREKQMRVFVDTRDFLEQGNTEGFVEAPTGFGKTVLFSEMIKATNQRTLVVVPSRILVEQTYQALKRFNPAIEIGRYYSDKKERDKQVMITTYQSLVISCGGVDRLDIDLLILDEVHRSLTDVRIAAVGRFTNPVKLGFTATPEYTQDKRVENLLNNEIHAVTLKEAVETGLLCSFSVYLAETNVDLSNIKIDRNGDYNVHELEEAINIYSRNKSAVELYKRLNVKHPNLSKAVTYCISIKHAQEVARIFNEASIRAEAIWSDQDPDRRRRIIEAYKRGEIKVLTNVSILTEGFDDPQAALCLNLRPTLSRVVAKQRGGRVLRLDPDNPKKHAIVVDYLDKNENKRIMQVTFAQVAEGAQIINPITIDETGTKKDEVDKGDKAFVGKISFDLEGLHVITSSKEVLRIVRDMEAEKYEIAPKGWLTKGAVASLTGKDPRAIEAVAHQYKKEHREWFGEYYYRGKVREYYSPDLLRLLLNRVSIIKKAPEGWMNINNIKATTGRSPGLIKHFIDQFRQSHPEWFSLQLDKVGKTVEFFSPQLVKLVNEKLDKYQSPPNDWQLPSSIAASIGRSVAHIQHIGDLLKAEHPEWVKTYQSGGHKLREYYSPEMTKAIVKQIANIQLPPGGWLSINQAADEIGRDRATIMKRANKLREQHPEWFVFYKHKKGPQREFLSPELIAVLKKEFNTKYF